MKLEITDNPHIILVNGKPRKCNMRKDKYYQIRIDKKLFLLHRLIAIQFIPNPLNLPQVNHKNGIKWDNRIENLEWVTASQNIEHAYRNLGVKPRKQKRTISYNDAQEIRKKYSSGNYTYSELAKEYGFNNKQMIMYIIKNKTYKSEY